MSCVDFLCLARFTTVVLLGKHDAAVSVHPAHSSSLDRKQVLWKSITSKAHCNIARPIGHCTFSRATIEAARSRQAWTVSCSADLTKFVLQPLAQVECVCTPLHPSVAPGLKLDSFHLSNGRCVMRLHARNTVVVPINARLGSGMFNGIKNVSSLLHLSTQNVHDTASAALCRKPFLFSGCCRRARQVRRYVRGFPRSVLDYVV